MMGNWVSNKSGVGNSMGNGVGNSNWVSKGHWVGNSVGNWVSNESRVGNSMMGNWVSNKSGVGNSMMGNWVSSNDSRSILRDSLIGDILDNSISVVSVLDGLDPAIRKSNSVAAGGGVTISGLSLLEVVATVV